MRWLISWAMYWVGDAISRPMHWFDWAWLYPAYNRIMCLSGDVQGDGTGPWKPEDK